jgi:hypothetical protein
MSTKHYFLIYYDSNTLHLVVVKFKVHDHVPVNVYRDGKCVQNTIEKYASRVRGLHGLVIGTQYPWLESILLGIKCTPFIYD